jgi:hypothetical protein
MSTLAATAIINYHLLFADQRKQTSFFRFCLRQTNGSLPFPFFVCRKRTGVAVFRKFCFPFALRNDNGIVKI